jgi:GT2 family glycosyltransferase
VHWNTPELTLRCLDALASMTPAPDRIVVVDNASSDDSGARLRARHPTVTLLSAAENLGFAAAVDLAVAHVPDADALWLVNSDAIPATDALGALIDAWRRHGDGFYGSLTLRSDARGEAWIEFPHKFLAPGARWSPWRRDASQRLDRQALGAEPIRVGALLGSSLLVPNAVLRRHGGMQHDWFLYCEEIDWCLRLRREGVASWLVPTSQVQHAGGGSHAGRDGVADVIAYYRARNEIVLARRHLGATSGAIVAAKKLLRGLATLPLQPSRAACVLRGTFDGVAQRLGKRLAPEARLFDALDAALAPAAMSWFDRLRRRAERSVPRWVTYRAGRSRLHYSAQPAPFILAYQCHCIDLIAQQLAQLPQSLEIALEDVPQAIAPKALRIGIQWEHTLVRPGGRDAADATPGATPLQEGRGTYLARLARRDALERCDLIIDYSHANRLHLQHSGGFDDYVARSIVVSPQPWAPCFVSARRNLPFVTLMHDTRQPRRAGFLAEARRTRLPLRNVRGIYASDLLRELHLRTRILINLHQTDHHHSFEELRVLPALLCGVIVVSEEVPLREAIPYADFIVWSRREDLLDTARAIDADYANQHARLFGDGRLLRVLAEMRAADEAAIAKALQSLLM